MRPRTFEVEKWMDDHESPSQGCKYNLAETCCASISLSTLLDIAKKDNPSMASMLTAESVLTPDTKQTYGDIRGSPALISNLASLYSAKSPAPFPKGNILITPGAIAGNFLAFYALLKEGDGVVCMYPTYQQLWEVPRSMGARVGLWKVRRVDQGRGWRWDVDDLKELVGRMEGEGKGVRMIVLNNPNNPTGAILKKSDLHAIVDLAKEKNILILSDEVYRPIFHGIGPMDTEFPPSALSLSYDNIIVTGSLSKAYSLAGIRVGWVASRTKELIEELAEARHYTTVSVSIMDQQVAALATSQMCLHGVLGRNIKLAKDNVALLESFVDEFRECEWVKPVAGTTAFVRFAKDGKAIDDVAFCEKLQEETGVMLLPGSRGFADVEGVTWEGYVRIGYVNETEVLKEGLEKLRGFMKDKFRDVPTADAKS